ncbi:MAG: cysteine peptidase family C39 domain-containing protein, partial [Candidatus Bathyarchaeia archaeon]
MRCSVGCMKMLVTLWFGLLCLPSTPLLADEVKGLIKRDGALQKAIQQLSRKNFAEAISLFEGIKGSAPKGSRQRALALLGFAEVKREESFPHILSGRGYPQRIKLAYEEALKEAEQIGDPEIVAAALLRLGDFESSWENWGKARELYGQAIATAPKSPIAGEAYVKLGQTYANFFKAKKNEVVAKKFFEKAATDYPNTFSEVIARYELGLQAIRQKKFQEAISQLSRAAEIVQRQKDLAEDPEAQHQRSEALYLLGWALARVGQKQSALLAFDEVANKYRGNFPPSPINRQVWLQSHIQKSLCLQQLGRTGEAINSLTGFINSNPEHFLSRRAQLVLLRIQERSKSRKFGLSPQPPQKILANLKVQNGRVGNECGLRALWAALQLIGKKTEFEEIKGRLGKVSKQGLSMRELLKLAESFGVGGFVVQASDHQSLLSLGIPIIAHLVNNHFVTILSISGTTVKLYDPSLGVHDLPIGEFQKQWSGFALILGSERKRFLVESATRIRYVSERESARLFGTQEPIGCVNHVGCDPVYAPLDDPCACNLDDLPELMGSPASDFPSIFSGPGGGCQPVGNTGLTSCAFPILLSSPMVQVGVRSGQAVSGPWVLLQGNSLTPRFVFALIYNNFETQEGPFGNIRWSYGVEGFVNGDTVQIVDWRGNRLYYQQLVDGSYLTPQGHIGFELMEVSNGSEPIWVWKHLRSGIKFVFKVEPTPPGGESLPPEEGGYASYRLYLAEVQDRNGNKLVMNYQWENINNIPVWRPISATDPSGGTWQFHYHPNSLLMSQVVDPIGNSVTFQWQEERDSQGKLVWRTLTVTDLAGSQWKFDFEIGKLLSRVKNPFGGEVRYEHINIDYGHFVGLKAMILPNGFKRVFAWTHPEPPEGYEGWVSWQQTTAGQEGFVPFYDAFGNPTYYRRVAQYSGYENPVLVKFWVEKRTIEGHRSVTEYDFDGLPVRMVDELGREWKFTYHPTGQPTQVIDPMGRVTQYNYDSEGRLLSVTDPAGRTTQYVYDDRGNLVQVINPLGLSRIYAYDSKGRKISETDALGNTTYYEYDQRGFLIKTVDPLGNITQYQRDILGRVTAITDPTGNTVYYSYDSASRVIQITYPDGTNEQFVYNCCALTQKIDANGNVTKYEYDDMGRLVKEVDPLGKETRYEYDLAGRKVAEID